MYPTLTLTQPWATLVALGEKKVETRSWKTNLRGSLAIHAAKAIPKNWAPFKEEHFANALEQVVGLNKYGVPDIDCLPRGVMVAVVTVVDCVQMVMDVPPFYGLDGYALTQKEVAFGHYGPGRYGWILDEPIEVKHVPVTGRQGLWRLPTGVASEMISS